MNPRIRKSFVYNDLNWQAFLCYPACRAKNPMIIVGSGVNDLPDSEYVFSAVFKIIEHHKDRGFQKNWNGCNVLQQATSKAAAYDVGSASGKQDGKFKFVYLLEADEISSNDIPNNTFVVYQGHHSDVGAQLQALHCPMTMYMQYMIVRDIAPSFASYNVVKLSTIGVVSLGLSTLHRSSAKSTKTILTPVISDYMADSITCASSTMAGVQ
ncbi:hypothetical protein BGZ81_008387 [Podila clonocystis]|nr:hypothetical protein BGZ81_008387 [Podila clonocystis]